MDKVTYEDLVMRYGNPLAFDLLLTIEKLARIRDDIQFFDENVRLQRALDALNNVNLDDNATAKA